MPNTPVQRKAQVWIAAGNSEGGLRVLLFHMLPERGGFWQPITGGVEEQESFREGAARELREESGFSASAEELIDLEFGYRFDGKFGPAEEYVFLHLLQAEEPPRLDAKEHIAAEWVSVAEAFRRITFPAQHQALEKVLHVFAGRSC